MVGQTCCEECCCLMCQPGGGQVTWRVDGFAEMSDSRANALPCPPLTMPMQAMYSNHEFAAYS